MTLSYSIKEKKVVDTSTGMELSHTRTNDYQRYTNYIFDDGNQKYNLSTDFHREPNDYKLPMKRHVIDVAWFTRVLPEGATDNNPLEQRQSDYKKYKSTLLEMLISYNTYGEGIEKSPYEIVIKFDVIEKSLGLKKDWWLKLLKKAT